MKRLLSFLVIVFIGLALSASDNKKDKQEVIKIKKVIIDSYISAVHLKTDVGSIKKGFYPGFEMLIQKENSVDKFPLAEWIKKLEERSVKSSFQSAAKIDYQIPLIDIAGNAAVARVEIFRDGQHIYSDYLSLYKLDGEWLIVSKIFYSYRN